MKNLILIIGTRKKRILLHQMIIVLVLGLLACNGKIEDNGLLAWLDKGFVRAVDLSNNNDVLAFSAAEKLSLANGGTGTVQEKREILEAGLDVYPSLFITYADELASFSETSRINIVNSVFRLSYTLSKDVLDLAEKYRDEPKKFVIAIKKIKVENQSK